MFTTSGTYPWSFVTQIFHNDQPSHGGKRKFKTTTYEVGNPGPGFRQAQHVTGLNR